MSDARLYKSVSLAHSTGGQKVPVLLVDATSAAVASITSPTLTLSKNGAATVTPSDGTWAEVGNGIYTIQLNATDTDTLGWITITVIHASAEDATVLCPISISANEERSDYIRNRRLYKGL